MFESIKSEFNCLKNKIRNPAYIKNRAKGIVSPMFIKNRVRIPVFGRIR